MSNHNNNRNSFRVEDKVSLTVRPIEKQHVRVSELFEKRRRENGLASQFLHQREGKRPNLLSIERRYPEISKYIEYLEEKIQLLANQSKTDASTLPLKPTHIVTLSASGIGFYLEKSFTKNSLVELSVRLFPSRTTIHTISTVTRCEKNPEKNNYAIALRFTHIHEEDAEFLYKHIHDIQMDSLKVVVN